MQRVVLDTLVRREPRDLHGLLDRLDAGGAPQFAAEFRRRL
ncbi:hypothetical protein AADR41_37670 [Streptomyces sp. CLV115]